MNVLTTHSTLSGKQIDSMRGKKRPLHSISISILIRLKSTHQLFTLRGKNQITITTITIITITLIITIILSIITIIIFKTNPANRKNHSNTN